MLQTNGEIKFSQINTELGQDTNHQLNFSDSSIRHLFGKDAAGSEIKISDGYGKYTSTVTYTGTVAVTTVNGLTALTWTSSGTFTISGSPTSFDMLIVGGGAGGDYRYQSGGGGGGGGGNQGRLSDSLSAGAYTVVIGAGGIGNGTTLNGATGGTSRLIYPDTSTWESTGGLPSGYYTGYNYGRGGTPYGGTGGMLNPLGLGGTGITAGVNGFNGTSLAYGSGGGGGGRIGGPGGAGAGNGGGSYQFGGDAVANRGGGAGGGGWYSGGTYYYGGHGGSGIFVLRGNFIAIAG